MQDYKEITSSQLPELRKRLLESQDFKCAICEKILDPNDSGNCNVDHQHLFKSEELGIFGNGLIRGVLCRECNHLEGKIWNNIHRYGKVQKTQNNDPVLGRIGFIEKLLNYYRNNLQHSEPILHPSERRIEKLGKSEYNQLIKVFKSLPSSYKRNGQIRDIPKFTGLWSPKLKELKTIKDSLSDKEFKKLKDLSKIKK